MRQSPIRGWGKQWTSCLVKWLLIRTSHERTFRIEPRQRKLWAYNHPRQISLKHRAVAVESAACQAPAWYKVRIGPELEGFESKVTCEALWFLFDLWVWTEENRHSWMTQMLKPACFRKRLGSPVHACVTREQTVKPHRCILSCCPSRNFWYDSREAFESDNKTLCERCRWLHIF